MTEEQEALFERLEELLGEAKNEAAEASGCADNACDEAGSAEGYAYEAKSSADSARDYAITCENTVSNIYDVLAELRSTIDADMTSLEKNAAKHRKAVLERHQNGRRPVQIAKELEISEVLVEHIISREQARIEKAA